MLIFIVIFALLFTTIFTVYLYCVETLNILAAEKHLLLRNKCMTADLKLDTELGTRTAACIRNDRRSSEIYISIVMQKLKDERVSLMIQKQRLLSKLYRRKKVMKAVNKEILRLMRYLGRRILGFITHLTAKLAVNFIKTKEEAKWIEIRY